MKRTLDGQIALTKYHSLKEFKEQLKDGKLKIKAQLELIFLKDSHKFEYYIKKFQLAPEVEKKLFQTGRKDLLEIYFSLRRCNDSSEFLLIYYPAVLSIYAKHHSLRTKAQIEMVKQKKIKTAMNYVKRRRLVIEAEVLFRKNAEKYMLELYDQKWLT